jgi:hypothetical protein
MKAKTLKYDTFQAEFEGEKLWQKGCNIHLFWNLYKKELTIFLPGYYYQNSDQPRCLLVRASDYYHEVPGSILGFAVGIFPSMGKSPQRPWSG